MLTRAAIAVLALVTATGCSSVRSDLIRNSHLHLEMHDTDKVRAIWISARERNTGIQITGALRRNDHTGAIIQTHVDVTVLSPDGKVLAEERSIDLRIPCNRVGAGSQRFKRFFVALALAHAGTILWQQEMGPFKARHGAGASPITLDGLMIVGNDNQATSFLAGLNGKTGEPVWQIQRDSKMTSYITPAVFHTPSGAPEVVFVSEAHGMTAVDPASGQVKWESEKLFTIKSVTSPVVAGDVIFATAGKGGAGRESAAVHPGNKPTVAWRLDKDLPYVCTPIAIGEHLYVLSDQGVMTCVLADTGQQVWQADLGENFYASPVCVNGRIYLVTRDGEVIVLQAGPEYKILAKSKLPEKTDATPAIANGHMYFRTLTHLICIGGVKAES